MKLNKHLYSMNSIIKKNYQSIVDRGLISSSTTMTDFIMKLEEEVQEFIDAVNFEEEERQREELSDIVLTCLNLAFHFGWDIEKDMNSKIKVNENRAILKAD